MKILKFLEENVLVKQLKIEQQKKKVGFLVCYWVHQVRTLLPSKGVVRPGDKTVRRGQKF